MAAQVRLRDTLTKYLPPWLTDRGGAFFGLTVGYRFLWVIAAMFDVLADVAIAALQAPWPGKGTPTALSAIGSSRGMLRGQGESDASYAARLPTWYDRARQWGSMLSYARAIHEYCGNRPRVRVYNRAGACLEVAQTTGAITRYAAGSTSWNWDSVSNPERAGRWWNTWVCVYPDPWARPPVLGSGRILGDGSGHGIGHLVTRQEVDAVKAEVEQYKSAHTHVVAIIWTTDATLFDPTNPATQPAGDWGYWSTRGSGARVASGRGNSTCRIWEL